MGNTETNTIPKGIDLRKEIITLSEKCLHTFIIKRIDVLKIGNSWQKGLKAFVDSQYKEYPDNMESLHSFLSVHSASKVDISTLDITATVPLLLYYDDFVKLYNTGFDKKVALLYKSRFFDFLNLRNSIRHYTEEIPESKREDFILDQMDGVCTIIRFSLLCEKHCKSGYFWKETIKKAFYLQKILLGEKQFLTEEDKETDLSPDSSLCEIEIEADSGNTSAQILLGKMLYEGNRCEMDRNKAFYWFYKAAKKNNGEAAYFVGKSYRDGIAVDFDFAKGMEWIQKSADLGYPPALEFIAMLMLASPSTQDKHELIEILNKLMTVDYPPAFWMMSLCYKGGIGVETNLQKTKELTEKAAILGYMPAVEELAKNAIKNDDQKNAEKWLETGASHQSKFCIRTLKKYKDTGHF